MLPSISNNFLKHIHLGVRYEFSIRAQQTAVAFYFVISQETLQIELTNLRGGGLLYMTLKSGRSYASVDQHEEKVPIVCSQGNIRTQRTWKTGVRWFVFENPDNRTVTFRFRLTTPSLNDARGVTITEVTDDDTSKSSSPPPSLFKRLPQNAGHHHHHASHLCSSCQLKQHGAQNQDETTSNFESGDGAEMMRSNRICCLNYEEFSPKQEDQPQDPTIAFMKYFEGDVKCVAQVGRSFFLLASEAYSLGNGLEIWFGYNQSVHLMERGPAVIVNFSAKAFHKSGSVIEYINEILKMDIVKSPQLERWQLKALSEKLKKIKVQVTHLPYPRQYIIKAITNKAARDLRLEIDGVQKTVARYFQEKYKPLKFAHLPCLHVQFANKFTYLPLEVCSIVPNQPVLGKLDGQVTAAMIRKTAISPSQRIGEIGQQVRDIHEYSGEAMKQFQLFMDMEFMKLNGHVIPAPALTYAGSGGQPPVISPMPNWTWRMDGKQCSWALMSFANPKFCNENCLNSFADTLCSSAKRVGIKLQQPKSIRLHDCTVKTLDALKDAKDLGISFAVIVLSRDDIHSYEEVKFMGDIKVGLVTQCIDENVISRKFTSQIAMKMLLKVNSKIGGVNHAMGQKHKIFSRPVIIMGADAAHSPRGYRWPSIAAVVGSLDAHPSQYAVTCKTQINRDENKLSQEVIVELRSMVKYILKCFVEKTRGKKPEKVIFFRDGVSEGQFKTVLDYEVEEIQKACYEVLNHVPPLTFIVVQKRHQAHFRPQNSKEGVGKMCNIPPGTSVDTDVVHPPEFFHFFICSHEGIQGTSKPAHYTVLFDENQFTADELQQLCYHLCHMYTRCNRSISIPAPVKYAHLACARAKKYADLHIRQMNAQSTVSSSSSDEQQSLPPEVERAINDMGDFSSMFYV